LMVHFTIQAALVICGLFICDFVYMRSRNDLFSGTYPLIFSHPWSFYMRIHYIRAYFWSPYPSHITRSNCTWTILEVIVQMKLVLKITWRCITTNLIFNLNWSKRLSRNLNWSSHNFFKLIYTFQENVQ